MGSSQTQTGPEGAASAGKSGFARAAQAGGSSVGTLKAQLSNAASLRPMMRALIEHPGIAADAERFAAAIDDLVGLRQEVTERVVRTLWPNDEPPDPYRARQVRREVAEVIGDLWRTYRDSGHGALAPQTVTQNVLMLLHQSAAATTEPPPFEDTDPDLEMQLSLGSAITSTFPTLMQLQELPGKAATLCIGDRSVDDWASRLRDRLNDYAESLADVMAGEREARRNEWRIAYKSVAATLGEVVGQSTATQYRLLQADLLALDGPGQKRYLNQQPQFADGVLMERIHPTLQWTLRTAYPRAAAEAGITVREPKDPAFGAASKTQLS